MRVNRVRRELEWLKAKENFQDALSEGVLSLSIETQRR